MLWGLLFFLIIIIIFFTFGLINLGLPFPTSKKDPLDPVVPPKPPSPGPVIPTNLIWNIV